MNEISSISNLVFPARSNLSGNGQSLSASSAVRFNTENDSSTDFGQALRTSTTSRAMELSSFAIARTRSVRSEIENGTYETPARIEGTVERLLDVIV